jgi:hypothetical protein
VLSNTGHMEFHKVLQKVQSHCYWPKMRQDVAHYIRTCPICQGTKSQPQRVGKLYPITVTPPFVLVGWDIMGPFPTSKQGNKYILVMTEYLTRWYEAEAIPNTSASTVANALLRKIIFPHGCPL